MLSVRRSVRLCERLVSVERVRSFSLFGVGDDIPDLFVFGN